jgi:hypothetical protein
MSSVTVVALGSRQFQTEGVAEFNAHQDAPENPVIIDKKDVLTLLLQGKWGEVDRLANLLRQQDAEAEVVEVENIKRQYTENGADWANAELAKTAVLVKRPSVIKRGELEVKTTPAATLGERFGVMINSAVGHSSMCAVPVCVGNRTVNGEFVVKRGPGQFLEPTDLEKSLSAWCEAKGFSALEVLAGKGRDNLRLGAPFYEDDGTEAFVYIIQDKDSAESVWKLNHFLAQNGIGNTQYDSVYDDEHQRWVVDTRIALSDIEKYLK